MARLPTEFVADDSNGAAPFVNTAPFVAAGTIFELQLTAVFQSPDVPFQV
jgi:hypothetical protein